jgi:uncharacterized protein (TIGR03083 family)
MESNPRVWIDALRQSHERLLGLVGPLTPEQLAGQSYASEWSIAQVLSHLGSGAEIAMMNLPVALGQSEPVGREAYQPVWDRWNAMTADQQAAAGIMTDAQYVQALAQLTDEELESISFDFFGMMTLDAAGLVRMRLGEHALHTWDVAVALDPAATVSPAAVELLLDNVPQFLAPRLGKAQDPVFKARIKTTDPERDYLLIAADPVTMGDWPVGGEGGEQTGEGDNAAEATMPAEALLRLAYGRMDAAHTPASVVAKPADLEKLRAIFPGF